MARYDVFNGDADGICALLQLRLAEPADSTLVTGVKRDIDLLRQVEPAAGDQITVLDVSMDTNKAALEDCLAAGAQVTYVDHHFPGEIPQHGGLDALIDTAPDTCTSLLVNQRLKGRFLPWAVTAAFGDNLNEAAQRAAAPLGLDEQTLEALAHFGVCINYNGYGAALEDLHFHPAALYQALLPYADPRDALADSTGPYATLAAGYAEDMAQAEAAELLVDTPAAAALLLPDAPWARRVSGVYGNALANDHPERAHAVVTASADGTWRISIRAPKAQQSGADALCRRWPTGGGRAGAGGVNALPWAELEPFLADFSSHWPLA
ncbi:MAG: hypothetical protein RLZZ174_2164 [Pseudomonadota bacterium]